MQNQISYWTNEKQRIDLKPKTANYLKLEEGTHEIIVMSEGEDSVSTFEGRTINQRVFKVKSNGEEKSWSVTKSENKRSLWYQLIEVGSGRGYLSNATLSVKVIGTGKNKSYMILGVK